MRQRLAQPQLLSDDRVAAAAIQQIFRPEIVLRAIQFIADADIVRREFEASHERAALDFSAVLRRVVEQEFVKILGADVPHITIPVRPGRDLARLIEVAAYQTKLKMSGYNPAKELNDRLIAKMAATAKL